MIKYSFKFINSCFVGEILILKIEYAFIVFFETNLMIICISKYTKIFIPTSKTDFSVDNSHLNLCGYVENAKWILCCQNTGVKCGY